MAKKANVRRYAQAIFELALERNEIEQWQKDLQTIEEVARDAGAVAVLENPGIPLDDKIKAISQILSGSGPLAVNLASMLAARGIFSRAAEIAEEFRELVDAYQGIVHAQVTTAVPLDDADEKMVTAKLTSLTGKKVIVKSGVDAEILGGMVARVGGKLLDGSTRTRLASLKRSLEGV